MSSIKGMLPSDVLVLRDGTQSKVPASELVTGDLIHVGMGEKVPADLRLIQVSNDLRFDRSILTGEVRLCSIFLCDHLLIAFQSEPVAGRVDMTDQNFLEVSMCNNSSGPRTNNEVIDEEYRSTGDALRWRFGNGCSHSDGR